MTVFLLIALSLAIAVGLMLLLPVLRRTNSTPTHWRTAVSGVMALAAAAVGLYFWLGTPQALQDPSSATMPSLEQATRNLAERLAREPDNLEGWILLGRSRMTMERPDAAVEAYREAHRLAPDNPTVLVELAEALAQSRGFRLQGEPTELIERALTLDPVHQRALWFGGLAAWQSGAPQLAEQRWERLLTQMDPDSSVAASVREQLQHLRELSDQDPGQGAAPDKPAPAVGPQVQVRVSLDQKLAGSVSGAETVYLFAREPGVGGPPLAVKRLTAGALPAIVTLRPSDAMTQTRTLADASEVVIVARVSRSGTAAAQTGDLEGSAGPVKVSSDAAAEIVIDRRIKQNAT